MFGFIVRIITAAGPVIYKIPGAGAAAQKIAAQLVKNGGKIIKPPKGGFKGPTKVATPANVAKAIKDLKKSNTGAGRPTAKKPGSNVKKKNETISSSQQGPGGVTVKPSGGIVRPKGGSTKTTTKPPKKDPKSPFAKETKAQKAARIKKEKIAAQRMKDNNKTNPSRDPKGKYNQRPIGKSSVPKSGAKPKPMTRRGKLVRGGTAILTGTQLLDLKGDTPQPVTKKVTPKTGQGRPSAIPSNRKKTSGVRPNLDKNTNTKKEMTFGEKFNKSRNKDKVAVFDFKGKKYTTRLKEESIKDHKKKFGVTGKY